MCVPKAKTADYWSSGKGYAELVPYVPTPLHECKYITHLGLSELLQEIRQST